MSADCNLRCILVQRNNRRRLDVARPAGRCLAVVILSPALRATPIVDNAGVVVASGDRTRCARRRGVWSVVILDVGEAEQLVSAREQRTDNQQPPEAHVLSIVAVRRATMWP